MFDAGLPKYERKPMPPKPQKRKFRWGLYAGLLLGAGMGIKYGPAAIHEVGEQFQAYQHNLEARKIADCIEELERGQHGSTCN